MFLLGVYCAVSPWVVHYTSSQPPLVTHDILIGALAVIFGAMCAATAARSAPRP